MYVDLYVLWDTAKLILLKTAQNKESDTLYLILLYHLGCRAWII